MSNTSNKLTDNTCSNCGELLFPYEKSSGNVDEPSLCDNCYFGLDTDVEERNV